MNEEVKHLTDRRAQLEELELVAMLEPDPIDAELAALRERMAPLEVKAKELQEQVEQERLEIDAVDRLRRRDARRRGSPAADRAVRSLRGAAHPTEGNGRSAARSGATATGVTSSSPPWRSSASAALPPGEVATCEQCGRILIPT